MQKTIFITGAAQGIGKATALLFAKKGWFIGLFDVNTNELAMVAEEIGVENCCFKTTDITQEESVKEAVEFFVSLTKRNIDVLFNNAGVIEVGEFDQISSTTHKKIIGVNFWGMVNCITHALPYLKNNPHGAHIINMSSASAIYGNPEITVYAATKSAVKSLTEGLEISLEKYRIKVSDILPIYVKTNMVTDFHQKYKAVNLDEVTLTAEDVALTVWKAVHKHQIHRLIGKNTSIFYRLSRIFPASVVRILVKKNLKYE
jgi:short-subunit dehydrogenase